MLLELTSEDDFYMPSITFICSKIVFAPEPMTLIFKKGREYSIKKIKTYHYIHLKILVR